MRPAILATAALILSWSCPSFAANEVIVPAQGGLGGLSVRIDLAASVVRYKVCAGPPCVVDASSPTIPITPNGPFGDGRDAKIDVVAFGQGKLAAMVRVPIAERPIAFEAIIVGKADASVVFAGVTGYVIGQPGGMTGQKVDVIDGEGGTRFVVVGDINEENRICGQDATLLAPRVLDPSTVTLRGASVQRLSASTEKSAQVVIATALTTPADKPLARLLAASGASTALGSPAALVDGDPSTTWSEGRSGAGRGEFVSFASPAEVPLSRLVFTIAPPTPPANGAAPKTFFVVAGDRTIGVTMPEDAWMHPGAQYEVPLSPPLKTSCLSIVLDGAYARNNPKPDVTLAEVSAYADLESKNASAQDIALALSGGGSRADAAAGLLKRAGDSGTTAVASVYDKLDPAGRALAMDVAATAPCAASGSLLVKALSDADVEVSHKAEGKLERCGKTAAPAMIEAVKGSDFTTRGKVAGLLALVAPSSALDVLASVLAQGPAETRMQVRRAFATAARSASIDKLGALLDDPARTADQKLDMLRALDPRLVELVAHASAALDGALSGAPDLRARYLALSPLATLARAHDAAATTRFTAILSRDPDASVRAQAAELSSGIAEAQPLLVTLLSDDDPRVRDAAVRGLDSPHATSAVGSLGKLLRDDPWIFVRAASAIAIGSVAASPGADSALASVLDKDPSPRVRAAVIDALGLHRASFARDVRKRLDDEAETIQVRTAAARALGAMCDARSYDRLTELAQAAASPVASQDELALALAAIDALGHAHPADVGKRLAPIDDKSVKQELRNAARHAFMMRGACSP